MANFTTEPAQSIYPEPKRKKRKDETAGEELRQEFKEEFKDQEFKDDFKDQELKNWSRNDNYWENGWRGNQIKFQSLKACMIKKRRHWIKRSANSSMSLNLIVCCRPDYDCRE